MSITNKSNNTRVNNAVMLTVKWTIAVICTLLYILEQSTRIIIKIVVVVNTIVRNSNKNNIKKTHKKTKLLHSHCGYVDCLHLYCNDHEMSLRQTFLSCLVNYKLFNEIVYLNFNQSCHSARCLTFLCMLCLIILPRIFSVLYARCHKTIMIIL